MLCDLALNYLHIVLSAAISRRLGKKIRKDCFTNIAKRRSYGGKLSLYDDTFASRLWQIFSDMA